MVPWKKLETLTGLDEIMSTSHRKPVAIYKHSTRCSVSFYAMKELERDWNFNIEDIDIYYLDVVGKRSISNAVAEKLGVVHQSPQLIVIHNGGVIYQDSHSGIDIRQLQHILD